MKPEDGMDIEAKVENYLKERFGRDTTLTNMEQGKLRGEGLISHRLSLEELPEAFRMMQARQAYFNKVVFFPDR